MLFSFDRLGTDSPFTASVLVVGDLILDEYLIGQATRLSREAAVPVLERTRRQLVAGGAANPAVGVVGLGGRASVCGIIGADEGGKAVRSLLRAQGVGTEGIVIDHSRPTTTKTRIIAEGGFVYGQHLARIDYLDRRPLAEDIEQKLLEKIVEIGDSFDVILVSDYKNGVITPTLVEKLRRWCQQEKRPLVVDSQGDLERFRHFDLVKCNRAEAEAFLEQPIPIGNQTARQRALATLRQHVAAEAVVVTLGGEGIAWQDESGYGECRAPRAQVFDVTGAGDTVIAVLALAKAAELPLSEACLIATRAAALTVRVMGNYAPTWDEVREALGEMKGEA